MTKTNKMFRAEDDQWEEFKKICEQEGRTRGEVLREAMQEYINTFKKEGKQMKIIESLKDNSIIVNAEWLEENDQELLDWITSSEYWGRGYDEKPARSDAIVEVHFNEDGVEYYATFKGHKDEDCPSRNQPPWGEDSYEDWETEDLKKYYKEAK